MENVVGDEVFFKERYDAFVFFSSGEAAWPPTFEDHSVRKSGAPTDVFTPLAHHRAFAKWFIPVRKWVREIQEHVPELFILYYLIRRLLPPEVLRELHRQPEQTYSSYKELTKFLAEIYGIGDEFEYYQVSIREFTRGDETFTEMLVRMRELEANLAASLVARVARQMSEPRHHRAYRDHETARRQLWKALTKGEKARVAKWLRENSKPLWERIPNGWARQLLRQAAEADTTPGEKGSTEGVPYHSADRKRSREEMEEENTRDPVAVSRTQGRIESTTTSTSTSRTTVDTRTRGIPRREAKPRMWNYNTCMDTPESEESSEEPLIPSQIPHSPVAKTASIESDTPLYGGFGRQNALYGSADFQNKTN